MGIGTTLIFVTSSAKRGLIADSKRTYLETYNLTCEYGTTVKIRGPQQGINLGNEIENPVLNLCKS